MVREIRRAQALHTAVSPPACRGCCRRSSGSPCRGSLSRFARGSMPTWRTPSHSPRVGGGVGDRASRDVCMGWSRPVSRVLFALRRDNHSSRPHVTVRLKQPTREQRGPRYRSPIRSCSGWGLPCHAALSPRAVRSYRTVSPLPDPLAGPSAVCSLLHWPSARAAQALPGTLPCGARTFLDAHKTRRDCPADSSVQFS
jgi:hypothetical protein